MKIKRLLLPIIFLLTFLLLSIIIKGRITYNYFQTSLNKEVTGPFESSNSTSRYALTKSIVENHSFFFNKSDAEFASPDMVKHKNKYFSIFPPGVSFLGVPFYIAGKFVGYEQIFTYLSTVFFALINFYLVTKIVRKFGEGKYIAILSGLLFLFASNALAYSLVFTQHHLSTMLVLFGIQNIFNKRTLLKNILLGLFFGVAMLTDIPNVFLMAPLLVFAFLQHFQVSKIEEKVNLAIKTQLIGFIIGLLPVLTLFACYNYTTTGSYTQIGQFIGRSGEFSPEVAELLKKSETNPELFSIKIPLVTRFQLNGFYILLISNERGLFYYSPHVLVGLIGIFLLLMNKNNPQKKSITIVLLTTFLMNIITYSMFGDPWGGWSFGPRYLIPATSLLCITAGIALQKLKRKVWFIFLFTVLTVYSLAVSIIGATTTNMVPPKQEAINLVQYIPYTYQYNLQLIKQNISSSLFYNLFLTNKISVQTFAIIYFCIILSIIIYLYVLSYFEKDGQIIKT